MPLFLFEQSVMLLGALLQNYRGEGDVPIGPTSNSGPPATGQVPTFLMRVRLLSIPIERGWAELNVTAFPCYGLPRHDRPSP